MKTKYEAPALEIELYELNEQIASNCASVVNAGPAIPNTDDKGCSDFEDFGNYSLRPHNVNFYEDVEGIVCDCYYTAGKAGYWQS